jgi:hypothetical protein
MSVKGFFEDYDGDIVLGDIRSFNDKQDFVEQAERYVAETRGYRVPLLEPTVEDIKFNDEDWKPADDPDFEGEKITVYVSGLDYDNKDTPIKFKVIEDMYWDDWGAFRKVFSKGQICEGTLHPSGKVTAESPYYPEISDYVDVNKIEIL